DLLERIELYLYRRADLIVSVTSSFRENLAARGIQPVKIAVVTNGVDTTRFLATPKDQELVQAHGLEGKFVAGYIGTHGLAHSLDTILVAAEKMLQTAQGEVFRFLFLGDGATKASLQAMAHARNLTNVIFVGSVSKAEVVRYWSLLDASIIHLKKSEL